MQGAPGVKFRPSHAREPAHHDARHFAYQLVGHRARNAQLPRDVLGAEVLCHRRRHQNRNVSTEPAACTTDTNSHAPPGGGTGSRAALTPTAAHALDSVTAYCQP
jgi:hypothetical protein